MITYPFQGMEALEIMHQAHMRVSMTAVRMLAQQARRRVSPANDRCLRMRCSAQSGLSL